MSDPCFLLRRSALSECQGVTTDRQGIAKVHSGRLGQDGKKHLSAPFYATWIDTFVAPNVSMFHAYSSKATAQNGVQFTTVGNSQQRQPLEENKTHQAMQPHM